MKPIKISFSLLLKFIFLITSLASCSTNLSAQDLDANQTLDYLNKKAQEFPFQNEYYIFYYTFSITPKGELSIEESKYFKSPFNSGTRELSERTIYKIGIDEIDVNESFQSNRHYSIEDIIYIYPQYNGSFFEEKIDSKGVQLVKKTIPYQSKSDILNEIFRNSISVYIGDVGKKENIKNAFLHLCTLIISDPIKYGLGKDNDPFRTPNMPTKSNFTSQNSSNTIKIIKTESGLIEIPIILNDVLRINFIFDSGASEVSLSPDVALTLMRTGTISESDWLPSQTYTFADGSKAKSKRFLIKKLVIGNQTLTNIEASISNSIEAPMLIGQNVMQKLGSVTIDYDNLLLIIKTK
jgi:aspartyl protease family protein